MTYNSPSAAFDKTKNGSFFFDKIRQESEFFSKKDKNNQKNRLSYFFHKNLTSFFHCDINTYVEYADSAWLSPRSVYYIIEHIFHNQKNRRKPIYASFSAAEASLL